MQVASRTLHNERLRLAMADAIACLREGSPLAQVLQAQKVFPPFDPPDDLKKTTEQVLRFFLCTLQNFSCVFLRKC